MLRGERWYIESEIRAWLDKDPAVKAINEVWLTEHLNRAFEKGKQIGRGELLNEQWHEANRVTPPSQ